MHIYISLFPIPVYFMGNWKLNEIIFTVFVFHMMNMFDLFTTLYSLDLFSGWICPLVLFNVYLTDGYAISNNKQSPIANVKIQLPSLYWSKMK